MNAQFQVAQLSDASTSSNTAAPPRVFRLAKPLGEQAVVVNLGFDQKVKLDFSGIANEKITLVRVGEKLIILFDNKSTLTVEPFFDSRHDGLNNMAIEVAPGREVSTSEFASLFPVTTDQSVLPAAGANGNAQASGANFSGNSVDPLGVGNPLDLLGQESLGNGASTPETFAGLPTTTPVSAGFTLSSALLVHDETLGVQFGNDQLASALPSVFQQAGLIGWAIGSTPIITSDSSAPGSNGAGQVTYALTTATGGAFNGVASGLRATVSGNEIFLFTEGNLIVGREGANPGGALVFQIYLNPDTLRLEVAQYEAIQHNNPADHNDQVLLAGVVFVLQTVTDGAGLSATAVSTGAIGVAFDDDGPSVLVTVVQPIEGVTRLATLSLDESFNSDRGGDGDGAVDDQGIGSPDPTGANPIGTVKTDAGEGAVKGDLEALFNVVKNGGTDTEKSTAYAYSFALTGGNAQTGVATSLRVTDINGTYSNDTIYLFKVSDTEIVGHVGNDPNGAIAIRITLENAGSLSGGQLVVHQYMAIDHGVDGNNFDSTQFLFFIGEGEGQGGASLGVTLTATITDGDNDTATSSATVQVVGNQGSSIGFQDDGPSIDVTVIQPEEGSAHLATLSLDESFNSDRGGGGDGAVDDQGTGTPDSTGENPIGELKTAVADNTHPKGDLEALFDVAKIAGTDDEKSTEYLYSFSLAGGEESETGGVETSLKVTDINNTYDDDTIYLFKVSDAEIVGHVGNDPSGAIAIRITLIGADSLSGGQLVVQQYMAIDHGPDSNSFDSTQLLNVLGPTSSLGVTLTATITDGDNDTATSSATIELAGNQNSSIGFQDDGPAINVTVIQPEEGAAHLATLSLDESFNSDRGGNGDGAVDDQGTGAPDPMGVNPIGELKTAVADDNHPQGDLEALFSVTKVAGTDDEKSTEYAYSFTLAGAKDPETGGVATTLKVTDPSGTQADDTIYLFRISDTEIEGHVGNDPSGPVAIRITLANFDSLSGGQLVVQQFMAIDHGPDSNNFDSAQLLNVVGTGASLGITLTATITDGDNDTATSSATVEIVGVQNTSISFQDDGPAVSVSANSDFGIVHDETLLLQNDDILFASVFNSVHHVGHDFDVPFGLPIGYARSDVSALTIGSVDFGTDGAAANQSQTYSLTLTNLTGDPTDGIDSGLQTTAGKSIYLFVENGIIVGRYDGNDASDQVTNTGTDPAAFAIAINPTTGQVSVVQYVSLQHGNTSSDDEPVSLQNALGSVKATLTVTDGDGDTASASAAISGAIQFQDDGPLVAVVVPRNFGVTADETPGNQANDVTNPLPVFANVTSVGHDPDVGGTPLAYATSGGSALTVVPYFGVDGPNPTTPVTYSLQLNSSVSGLQLTDGSPISLHLENDGAGQQWVVGRVDSGPEQGNAAFAVAIDPATGKVSVVEYLSLYHPNDTNPDDQVSLAAGAISAVVTIKDGDGDTASATADISARIHFNDDGPSLTVGAPAVIRGLDFGSFNPNGNAWGTGSGTATGTNGGWTIADANLGHAGGDLVGNTGAGAVQLERVGDGYLGLHSSTGGFMVDLDASAHDVQISQVVNGLAVGQTYDLRFEAGSPSPGTSHLEIWFGGVKVGDITPTGQMQQYAIMLTGGSGDASNRLEFRETGTPDNYGTYLANVSVGDIVIDETAAIQPGSNEVAANTLFDAIAQKGIDTDMSAPQFAAGTSPAVSVAANFGTDGPFGGSAATGTSYSVSTTGGTDHFDSGLTTTAGKQIYLFNETYAGVTYVVGRYDSDGVGGASNAGYANGTVQDAAAFAFSIDSTGHIQVVQYVSLYQPNTASNDEGVFLKAGSLSVNVTVTDGDSDSLTKSADVSASIRFDDDGPTLISGTSVKAEVDEDGLHSPGLSNSNADGSPSLRDGEEIGTNSASANSTTYGELDGLVNFGADGFGSFSLKAMNSPANSGLQSKGADVLIITDANGLHGYVDNGTPGFDPGDREIFTLTVGSDGIYIFTLKDQIDHPELDGEGGANNENTTFIDLSTYVVATDGDGDGVPLGAGTFTVKVLDDIPVVTVRAPGEEIHVDRETLTFDFKGGNDVVGGVSTNSIKGIWATGEDLADNDDTANTSNNSIGIGDGQSIDGLGHQGQKTTGPEILTLEFFENVNIPNGNGQPTHGAAYDVNVFRFSIDAAESQQNDDAVVFVSVLNNGSVVSPNDYVVTINGAAPSTVATVHNVYDNGTLIGYVFENVPDDADFQITSASGFDTVKVGNYNGFAFTTDNNASETVSTGNSFKVYGLEADILTEVITLETFKVSHDESPGVNTAADPNAANDIAVDNDANTPAPAAPSAIFNANAIGYARSEVSVTSTGSLFAGTVGADENGTWSFKVTSANGGEISNLDSGLKTLDGTHIMLTSEASGAIVGMANQTAVFRVYVDADGFVWVAQYQAIQHDTAGSSPAAFDEIATITAALHIQGTLTDSDHDAITKVSPVALNIQFQDDGPLAIAEGSQNVVEGSAPLQGQLDFNPGTDGATVTQINGVNLTFGNDGYSQAITTTHGSLQVTASGAYKFTPQADDFYQSGGASNFTYTVTDGDGDTSGSTVAFVVTDDTDVTTVTLNDRTVNEGAGTATITASVDHAPQGSNLVLSLSNGATITILAGQTTGTSTPFAVQGDDPYTDNETNTVSITGSTGGNYESLNKADTATVTINDTIDPTTVTLSASTVLEGSNASYVFTATLSNASHGITTITTDRGVITILNNQTTGTLTVTPNPANGEDPYVDPTQLTATVTAVSGGNFENLTGIGATATAHINDTTTTNFVTLDNVVVAENQTFVYTAHLDYAPILTPFTVTLSNNVTITFAPGQTIATSAPQSAQGDDVYLDGQVVPVSITGASGGGFEAVNFTTYGNATVTINDTTDPTTVSLSASTVSEGPGASYLFTATLSNASHGTTTITTDRGVITIGDGQTTGTLTVTPNPANGEDPYLDSSQLTANITNATGGNFENLTVTGATATAHINDTTDPTTVSLSASTVSEGPGASYLFTATLLNASQGITTITTDRGVITIADGQTTGTLTVTPNPANSEDPYLDSSQLTANITNATGGNFENLQVLQASATAHINDTTDPTTVSLSASTVSEGPGASYLYTATLSNASQGTTTITTDRGVITIGDGLTTGTLTVNPVPVNGEDPYLDSSQLTANITNATGGNFENLTVTGATATAHINDTTDPTTVSLSASTVSEGPGASYLYTATLSNASQGITTITTDQGVITIGDGLTTGTLTVTPNPLNGEDPYLDSTQLTANITNATGGNFENLQVLQASATARINDTITTNVVTLDDVVVAENQTFVYTAHLDYAPISSPLTVTLSNNVTITFGIGQTTASSATQAAQGDDVYLDGQVIPVSITGTSGGNFEAVDFTTHGSATVTITDTVDPTTVTLTGSTVSEGSGASYVYTATLSNASHGTTTITTDQGVITIGDGLTTGTLTVSPAVPNGEDVYKDPTSLTVTITNATGGDFENLTGIGNSATAKINDTTNSVTATLTTATTTISESGGSIIYTVTLSSGLSPFTPTAPLDFLLSNGEHVIIAANASSGSVTKTYTDAEITNQASITASISSVSSGGTEYEQLLTTGSTSVPVVYSPTISVGPNNGLSEDTQEGIQFTATVGGSSHVTQITVSGLTGWIVDATPANIALTGGGGTASVSSASFTAGVLTINITGAADGAAVTAAVLMQSPLNSDVDGTVSMTATSAQGATTATSAATPGTIYVDAVADMPAPVTGQTHILFVKDSPSDSNTAFSNGETGSLQVKATIGDVHDGSETHVLDIHLQNGFTAGLAASGTITGTYNGVNTTFSYTYTSGTGDIRITVPNDTALNLNASQTANIDLSFAVTAPASGALPDNLNFSVTAKSTEATLSGGGVGAGNADLITDNVATLTDSTAIPAARLLSGAFTTNTNSSVQEAILSFIDEAQPLDAFSQLLTFTGTGQASTFAGDAGFNITGSHTFEVVLESAFTATSQINVTNFVLNGVTMNAGQDAISRIHYGLQGSTTEALTSEIVPDGAHNTDTYLNSLVGNNSGTTLTGTGVNGNYVYGFSGDDTLNGGSGNTFLNGGAGADTINGDSANDVIVFDTNDTSVNGGAGFDILRIDAGAIYNTSLQVSGAPNGGLSAANSHNTGGVQLYDVDLSTENLTNLEAILLTTEAVSSSGFGTELHGLTAANVVAFTGGAGALNSQTGTANTLFILGSAGDDVQLTGFAETATTYTSSGGQLFHQWVSTSGPTATLFIDNDLQVNHAAQ